MKYLAVGAACCVAVSLIGGCLSVEHVKYTVVKTDGDFEIRDYPGYVVAETVVDASMEDAGNKAFRRLFNYISGENTSKAKIAMTAPVEQEAASEKIAMTAPVEQTKSGDSWKVTFAMPAEYTMQTLPTPNDSSVTLRQVPARRMASVEYSGGWSQAKYSEHLEKLREWMSSSGLEPKDDPLWARYDPPFKPSFLRRNEILIPIAADSE